MYSTESWKIFGYLNKFIPNIFYLNQTNNNRISVIFPGFGYSSEAPLLFYLKELIYQMGYDVLSVDYAYNKNNEFLQSDETTQDKWFQKDVEAVYAEVCQHKQYKSLVLIGKSLGTTALLHLVNTGLQHSRVCFIWITPGTSHSVIAKTVSVLKNRSLIITGSKDPYYDPKDYELIKSNLDADVKIFENAGHILEIENDIGASIDNVKRCISEVYSFLSK